MRLIKIVVEAFQCIEKAEIELAPGLNILYGPNDHGKSTLATAIRAGLLLPHSSTAKEDHLSWHTGESPQVNLTFWTEEQRYWRIRKNFGKTGSSTLDQSKDGAVFSKDCDGRQVDDKVRQLLAWGIPKPGGTGNTKGLPDSFLTTVLLASQTDVPGILGRGLESDKEDSGRARLNQALQALAQDPIFKKILDKAKQKTTQAFAPSGKLSRASKSPLAKVTEQIQKLKEEQATLDRKIQETDAAEQILCHLQDECSKLEEALHLQQERMAKIQKDYASSQTQIQMQENLSQARQQLAGIQEELSIVAQEALAQKAREQQLEQLRIERTELQQQEAELAQALQTAQKKLEAATSDQGSQQLELRRQQLQNERLVTEQNLTRLRTDFQQAEAAQALADESSLAATALGKLQEELQQLRADEASLQLKLNATVLDETRLRQLREFASLREARSLLMEAEQAARQAEDATGSALEQRQKADGLEAAVADLNLPRAQELKSLEKLALELEKAEARLGGGLSIAFQPLRELELQISADAEASQSFSGQAIVQKEAQRTLKLMVEGLFEATISAGEASARQLVEELRQRWSEVGQPVLTRTGRPDITCLVEACQEAEARLAEAKQLRQQADHQVLLAREHQARAERLPELRDRVTQREHGLTDCDQAALLEMLDPLGKGWETELASQATRAEKARQTISASLQQSQQKLNALSGRLEGEQASHVKAQERATAALAAFPDGTSALLQTSPGKLAALESSLQQLDTQISNLLTQASSVVSEAEASIAIASKALDSLGTQRSKLEQDLESLTRQVAGGAATLELRQKQTQVLNPQSAEKRVAELEAQVAQIQGAVVTATDVEQASQAVKAAQELIQDKEKEIHQARGRMSNVGGNVVRDQKTDLDRALSRAIDREHEIQVEYSAWKLLMDTLREVENTHGAHLGKALSGPLSTRLSELSSGRYAQLEIDPHLKGQGLQAAGSNRSFGSLSEGTKDQVATLFRLGIAEHLGSAIILDDHLNQSDPEKIQWFLQHLCETSKKIQVILITCRPGDYLKAGQWPMNDQPHLDLPEAGMRAVNLGKSVKRYPTARS